MNDDFVLAVSYEQLPWLPFGQRKRVVITGDGTCSRCQKVSYSARQLGDQWICSDCMKKEHIDDRWIYDYQQAFDEIDREFPRINE